MLLKVTELPDDSIHSIQLLQYEVQELKKQIIRDEGTYEERISALEESARELRRKLAYGRGVFWGLFIAISTLGIFLVDQVRDVLDHVKNGS